MDGGGEEGWVEGAVSFLPFDFDVFLAVPSLIWFSMAARQSGGIPNPRWQFEHAPTSHLGLTCFCPRLTKKSPSADCYNTEVAYTLVGVLVPITIERSSTRQS